MMWDGDNSSSSESDTNEFIFFDVENNRSEENRGAIHLSISTILN
jgi:hypothetical protein